MPDYRTPLPRVFASTLEGAVNRVLALDPAATDRLKRLEGKVLQLDVEGLGMSLYFTTRYGVVHIDLDSVDEPDTVIRGTPFALFAMAAPGEADSWGLPGSRVHISGDANLARDMERVFSKLDPDWESQLTGMFGDVIGFQLAAGLKQGAEFLRQSARKTAEMAGNYLRDEASVLVRPQEFREFSQALEELGQALNGLEARLAKARGAAG